MVCGTKFGRFTTINTSKYEHFASKINKTYSSCVSVVVSGDFYHFKIALPSLLFRSKDKVKAVHSDFDRNNSDGKASLKR